MTSPHKVERKIYFYRINTGRDNAGQLISFNPQTTLETIDNIPFVPDGRRYLVDDDGNAICAWIDNKNDPYHLRFGRIRRSSLPQLEQSGTLSDLPVPPDSGLVEQVHVVFFSNNIVGSEFNFYGPRLSRLGYYLKVKVNGFNSNIIFEPLIRHDILEQLEKIGDIRILDLRIRPSFSSAIKEADTDLASAFEANRKIILPDDYGDEIQIVLHYGKHSRNMIVEKIVNFTKRLVGREDLKSGASRFKIKGKNNETCKVEDIDLLHGYLISKKHILKLGEKNRALDPNDAYRAIHSAYDEQKDQLELAASLI